MSNTSPKFTIITVSYNCRSTIEKTITTVIGQTYKNIEYIIIDGGSRDGTLDILRKYSKDIAYWVSEPDSGIYDAMNKGIKKASGDWIYFIGGDDYIITPNVIEKMADIINCSNADVFCGRVIARDYSINMEKTIGKAAFKSEIINGYMSPHQGMVVRAKIMKSKLFDNTLKVAADFKFFLECALEDRNIKYVNDIIAVYSISGASSSLIRFREYAKVIINMVGFWAAVSYLLRSMTGIIKRMILIFLIKKEVIKKIRSRQGWRTCSDGGTH